MDKWLKLEQRSLYKSEKYHVWKDYLGIPHNELFIASNRHMNPSVEIKDLLINNKLSTVLEGIGISNYDIWDEGLGWLAFRFIRPGMGDGYPFSRKSWGIAKDVSSFWIPIIGCTDKETIALVPKSHKKEYKKYMPENTKYAKEYRLAEIIPDNEIYRPNLDLGEILIFNSDIIHSEEIKEGVSTRLSLEFRINPI